jgi:hypothetical protein
MPSGAIALDGCYNPQPMEEGLPQFVMQLGIFTMTKVYIKAPVFQKRIALVIPFYYFQRSNKLPVQTSKFSSIYLLKWKES